MSDQSLRRVAVTGLGAVSSLGIGAQAFIPAIRAGRSGIRPVRSFDATGFDRTNAGEVRDFQPGQVLRRLDPSRWGRSALFAAAAARFAVADAGLDADDLAHAATGTAVGTSNGEAAVLDDLMAQWVADGFAGLDAAVLAQAPAGQIGAAVNAELGLSGEALTVGTACAASNYALGYGFDLISTGEADFMLCGGADSVNRVTHAGFHRLGAIAQDVSRPFDAHRDGIVPAEGGAVLLLEPLEQARRRGARIYAEVLGYGMNCDAVHMTHPDRASIAECIRLAHRDAGVRPEDVDYICAHGTGTQANDETEVGAVRDVFGDRVPPISSIKSMIGHTMGAASGFGALVCCAALHEGFLPPTATVRELDPALGADLDVVPGRAREGRPRIVQNHGFAFGGNNAITILAEVRP